MSASPIINMKKKKDPGKQGLLVHLWGQGLLKDAQVLILESVMIPWKVKGCDYMNAELGGQPSLLR